jgi:hypothetical protein
MDTSDKRPKFDFDAWAELARNDPQAFELERKLLLERAIMKAPAEHRQRLRCLQWKIDQIRNLASTPMAACLQINRLLWENICGEHGLLNLLQRMQIPGLLDNKQRTTAKILPFQGHEPASLPPADE